MNCPKCFGDMRRTQYSKEFPHDYVCDKCRIGGTDIQERVMRAVVEMEAAKEVMQLKAINDALKEKSLSNIY